MLQPHFETIYGKGPFAVIEREREREGDGRGRESERAEPSEAKQ